MKTKLFITIISAIFSLQLLNAQTTYMPVFGDTTRYYWARQGIDGSQFYCFELIRKNDSIVTIVKPTYFNYDSLIINKTNSKIWGMKSDGWGKPLGRFLLMDLDLQVGEKFTDQEGTVHTVHSVYLKDNRKHIRFENYLVQIDLYTKNCGVYVDSTHFEFIEGVGNNICFYEGTNTQSAVPWLRSKYIGRMLAYGAPEWSPCWDEYTGFTVDIKKTISDNSIRLSPSPVTNKLNVEIPKSVNLKNTLLNIYDINGKQQYLLSLTEHKIIVDVSQFGSGIYLVQVISNDYNETVKFIKS